MFFILCFVPLLFAFCLFTFVFKLKISHQLLAILLGLAIVFPISVIQYVVPTTNVFQNMPIVGTMLKSLIIYGLVEELFKTIVLVPVLSTKSIKEEYSALQLLFLSFLLGLSLACFESLVYLFDRLQIANNKGAQLLYHHIFLRIFTSDLIHMSCAGLCGLFVISKRYNNNKSKISYLFLAILLHGIYDFFAGFQNNLKYFSYLVVLLALIECRVKYTALTKKE
ncbi:MAG: PrsW family intramembrane metalloprotease [Treponema bryantii]|mgnify:FL=1|nr:PrsW family intramembrane metalloprotease [Treponema bryantii]